MAASSSIAHGHREEAHRQHVILLLGLAELGHLARDRRFQAHVVMAAIALAAIASLGRDNRSNAFAHLTAWDKRQNLRHQRAGPAR
jgi:hypothetical protein